MRSPSSSSHPPMSDSRAVPATRRMLRRWWWLPSGLIALLLWCWLRTDAPAPPTRARELLQHAADALARGHLSAPDGSGARELYEAAQAMDPDLPEARRGRVDVGRAALARAQAALARGEVAAARGDLELARQLQVPRAQLEAVSAALREQGLAQVDVNGLLARADAARAQGWWVDVPPEFPDESAALPLYQQLLTLFPGHADALRGREEALAHLLEQARAALRMGDLEFAAAAIAHVRAYDPGHIDLPDTLARLTEERAGIQQQASAALAHGQVETAIERWQHLLALDRDDLEARGGIERAVQRLAEQAAVLGERRQFDEAARALARAREILPSAPALHAAEVRIARARQHQERAPTASLQVADACFQASLAANDLGRARACLEAARAQGEAVETLAARRRQLALRWIAIGEERLRSGNLSAATTALNSARETDPATPGLQALALRLETVRR